MRMIKALAALAITSLTLVACGAPEGSEAPTDQASSALSGKGGLGANCAGDATCSGSLVCDAHCPVIPGRPHCEIAGGVCAPKCTESGHTLNGKTFTSLDGAHTITFESTSTYHKVDSCPTTGTIHCNHIAVADGTYVASGSTIALTSTLGAHDTLDVEPHCYDGLLDTQNNVELYPAN
jgi:hypothetical protein